MKEMLTEEAEIELLRLDQKLVTDTSKIKNFGELVRHETKKLL
jgi:hypothetical protein